MAVLEWSGAVVSPLSFVVAMVPFLVVLVLKWSTLEMGGDRHQLLGYLVLLFLGRDAKEGNLDWGTLKSVFSFKTNLHL